ncbi:MAG: ATP-grasp domain-containing protein [Sedimentisphaerales bacterium]|nr:ATP-grasp domain-containing protein [Sedimentisphaerales bacterium]
MKVVIVYNHDSRNVINLFGVPNRERIAKKTIGRITNALRSGGHQVKAFEGDKDLVDRLEEFMPRVIKGEQPGLVFNVSYGIQGQARYTHVPGILEMVGIPYVGSGPLAHGLALDKVVAKMIFRQNGIPTPDFAVLNSWETIEVDLNYPLIVKPRNEAVSFGITVVKDQARLQEAVKAIMDKFQQPVLVEEYIRGREINVGLIGNHPPEIFPPVELLFGRKGPKIYTYEDKTRRSEREIHYKCPAPLTRKQYEYVQNIGRQAFESLGCYDCARVDIRMDKQGNFQVLEVNSLPSLGEHGSYLIGAGQAGLDFNAVINRLVEVASARYFGTPDPQKLNIKDTDSKSLIHNFLTQRRDQMERRLESWTNLNSRSNDSVGIHEALKKLNAGMDSIGLSRVPDFSDDPFVRTWQTRKGFTGGTLLIGHLDVPVEVSIPGQSFRRDPEWLYGEGIGLSRGPLIMLEFVLRGLKTIRALHKLPLGILYYTDEGRDCHYSAEFISKAAEKASQVLILRPGNMENKIITQRRGQRRYRLRVDTSPKRLGKLSKNPDALQWTSEKIGHMTGLSSRKDRLTVAVSDIQSISYPMLLPHRVTMTILVSYGEERLADATERKIREILGPSSVKYELEMLSDRPPMKLRNGNRRLARKLSEVAQQWEIPLSQESSLWPTVGGLVPKRTGAVCGLGPVAKDLYTPQEAVQRISILQRTLLLAEFLLKYGQGY